MNALLPTDETCASPVLSVDESMPMIVSKQARSQSKTRKIFYRLALAMQKLFECEELCERDVHMSEAEQHILCQVALKKLVHGPECDLHALEGKVGIQLAEHLNSLIFEHKSTKRVEENNKFIYKYTMKYLKKEYFTRNSLKSSKEAEIAFYQHYFASMSAELKISIDDFYDPLYKTLNKNPSFKTINNKYLSLIFSSNAFKADFFAFLKSDFKRTYIDMIPGKLNKFFKKLKDDMSTIVRKNTKDGQSINKFTEKLRRSRKCKLPWTCKEVTSALAQFNSLIYYY